MIVELAQLHISSVFAQFMPMNNTFCSLCQRLYSSGAESTLRQYRSVLAYIILGNSWLCMRERKRICSKKIHLRIAGSPGKRSLVFPPPISFIICSSQFSHGKNVQNSMLVMKSLQCSLNRFLSLFQYCTVYNKMLQDSRCKRCCSFSLNKIIKSVCAVLQFSINFCVCVGNSHPPRKIKSISC